MDRIIFLEKLKEYSLYIFIFFLSLFPFQYIIIKLISLAILLLISILQILKTRKINKFYLLWFFGFLSLNFFYLNYGGLKNIQVYKTYIGGNFIWIIIYFFIFTLKIKKKVFKNIEKILEFSFYLGMIFLIIAYINFNYFNIFNLNLIVDLEKIERPGQYSKITGFISAITPMIYISCFLLSKYIYKYIYYNNKYIFKLFLIIIIFIFITMRKILLILYPCVILLNIIFILKYDFVNKKIKKLIIKIIIFITVFLFIVLLLNHLNILDLDNFIKYIKRSFNYFSSKKYAGVTERKEQILSLIEGIKLNFLFGAGLGAEVSVKRSYVSIGSYELTYLAKIFHMGVIGFLIWVGFIRVLILKVISIFKKTKDYKLFFYLSGTLGILIVNATNPYLGSFEFDWMLYILLFLINNQRSKSKNERNNISRRKWNKTLSSNKSNK